MITAYRHPRPAFHPAFCTVLLVFLGTLFSQPALAQTQLLTRDEAIARALRHHPRVAAAALQAQAARATAQGIPSFPEASVALSPSILGPSKDALIITQELGGGRQLLARLEAARAQADQAQFAAQRQMQEVRYQVSVAYIHLQAAQKVEEAWRQNVLLAQRFLEVAQAQFKAGNVPQANVIRAEVELATANQELAQASAERTLQQDTLQALVAPTQGAAPLVATDLNHGPSLPVATNLADALADRPDLRNAERALIVNRAAADQVRAQVWPTFSLKGFVDDQRDIPGTSGVAVGVQVLPWSYQTLPKQIEAAELSVQAADKELEAVRQQAITEARTAYQRWWQAHQASLSFEQGTLGRTEKLVALAQEGFRLGANSYLEVLDAQRTQLTIRLSHIMALENENLAAAEYQLAIGAPLTEVSSR